MSDKNKKTDELEDEEDLDEEEESDEEDSEDEDSEDDEDDSTDEEDDEEDDSKHLDDKEDEEDEDELDEELEREDAGKPNKEKAQDAFHQRDNKRKGKSDDKGDKPLTRGELDDILAEDRKARQEVDAFQIAQTLTKNPKAAKLMVAKWRNRTFPAHLTLQEQMTEMYGAVFAKRLMGEKSEALRALKNKGRVSKDGGSSHHDGQPTDKKPKGTAADIAAIKAAGWQFKGGAWEKNLANGKVLIRDPKTGKTRFKK